MPSSLYASESLGSTASARLTRGQVALGLEQPAEAAMALSELGIDRNRSAQYRDCLVALAIIGKWRG